MTKTNANGRVLANLSLAAFIGLGYLFGMLCLVNGVVSRALLGFGSAAFLLIPWLMKRLRLGHPYRLYTVLFLFCVLAYDIGCVYQRFDIWPYYDKIVHFLSGTVFTIIGYCLYYFLAQQNNDPIREQWLVATTYALFFSAFVAVIWEICEFTGFVLTGHDSQHTLTTGVFDTMEDLISCMGGSLLSALSFFLFIKRKFRLLTPWVVEEFFSCNQRRLASK